MLFETHILLGLFLFFVLWDFFNTAPFLSFGLVLVGSIIPDIDSRYSKINRWSGLFGQILTFFVEHRGLFHSLFLYVFLCSILWYFVSSLAAFALFLGYFSHVAADSLTRKGVKLFYPFSSYTFCGPFLVGGFFENILLVALVILTILRLYSYL